VAATPVAATISVAFAATRGKRAMVRMGHKRAALAFTLLAPFCRIYALDACHLQ